MTQMANVPRGYLYGSIIYLNDYYLNQLSSHIQLAVAEHELGHAIGLNHNDTEPSVMNPAVSDENAYTIQKCDIEAVKRIYHKRFLRFALFLLDFPVFPARINFNLSNFSFVSYFFMCGCLYVGRWTEYFH